MPIPRTCHLISRPKSRWLCKFPNQFPLSEQWIMESTDVSLRRAFLWMQGGAPHAYFPVPLGPLAGTETLGPSPNGCFSNWQMSGLQEQGSWSRIWKSPKSSGCIHHPHLTSLGKKIKATIIAFIFLATWCAWLQEQACSCLFPHLDRLASLATILLWEHTSWVKHAE